jgi:hypothetical protein
VQPGKRKGDGGAVIMIALRSTEARRPRNKNTALLGGAARSAFRVVVATGQPSSALNGENLKPPSAHQFIRRPDVNVSGTSPKCRKSVRS